MKKLNQHILTSLSLAFLSSAIPFQSIIAQSGAGAYQGTPYKVLKVPGIIEAEDYDNGGPGISYQFKNSQNGNAKDYREDKGVAISRQGQTLAVGNVSNGDWLNYTIEVTQEGVYEFETYCVSGGNGGRFYFELDGQPLFKIQEAPYGAWNDYSQANKVEGLVLKAGRHLLTWRTFGGMNFDRVVISRTGNITGKEPKPGEFNYTYPMQTRQTGNPLFVDLPSQMYESPFEGNLYTADPSAHVWTIDGKERLYVYASHDMEPTKGCDHMDRYHIFSTDDLVNWTDHGEILSAEGVNKAMGTRGPGFMWAPDCAYNPADKLYYFYFPKKVIETIDDEEKQVWHIFVATSKNPATGFQVKGYIEGIPSTIDPCVFVDDDGQPYIYTSGGGKGGWGCKLDRNNWMKLDGEMTPMEGFIDFHEAPWVFKRNGIYYMTNSDNHRTNLGGNRLVYSMSDSPLGPWKQYGAYMYPHGEETAHGSVVEFKGKWYAFYHTANYSGQGALRSVCFDPIEFDDKGHLQVVRNWGTPKGGKAPQIYLGRTTRIEAENYNEGGSHYAFYKRPGTELTTEKVQRASCLTHMGRKEWTRYTIDVKDAGRYNISCRVMPNRNNSKFRIGIDGVWCSPNDNEVKTPLQQWSTIEVHNIELEPGEHYLEWRSIFGDLNLDYIEVSPAANKVPGTIEAEDFDNENYQFKNKGMGNALSYRKDKGVALSSDKDENTGQSIIHLSNTSGGDWTGYTFDAEKGTYDIIVYAATAGNGRFRLSLDQDAWKSEDVIVETGHWHKYSPFTVADVKLTQGRHELKLHILNGINVDRIEFIKKSQSL